MKTDETFVSIFDNDELKHYGVLGMKWGVRRYQNKDGSLTPLGKARLAKKDSKWDKKNVVNEAGAPASKSLSKRAHKHFNEVNQVYTLEYAISGDQVKAMKSAAKTYDKLLLSDKSMTNPSGTKRVSAQYFKADGYVGIELKIINTKSAKHSSEDDGWVVGEVLAKYVDKKGKLVKISDQDAKHEAVSLYDEYLKHYGVLGMKWGIRRYQPYPKGQGHKGTFLGKKKKQYAKASENKKKYQQKKRTALKEVKKTPKEDITKLSDAELRARVNRMNLEQQYSKLSSEKTSRGKSAVTKILATAGTGVAVSYTSKAMTKVIETALKKVLKAM